MANTCGMTSAVDIFYAICVIKVIVIIIRFISPHDPNAPLIGNVQIQTSFSSPFFIISIVSADNRNTAPTLYVFQTADNIRCVIINFTAEFIAFKVDVAIICM
ncbi:hypothetical protein [Bartonella apis]|uniref:hypothetical protein n=1 Tax=Bartonella apis TaxID=1686310 RepID=UPI003F931ED7